MKNSFYALLMISAALGVGQVCAENIYSPNVAGFVRVPVAGNGFFSLLANPLSNTNNSITNIFVSARDGDQIYRWNAFIQDLKPTPSTYSSFAHTWDVNFILKPGEGVFYLGTGSNYTNTFVGDVMQGSITNPVPILGSGSFNMIASSVPIGGSFTNAIGGIHPYDGDQVYGWDVAHQDLYPYPFFGTYSSFAGLWDRPDLIVDPGIGFFYLSMGPNQNPWVRTFTVP